MRHLCSRNACSSAACSPARAHARSEARPSWRRPPSARVSASAIAVASPTPGTVASSAAQRSSGDGSAAGARSPCVRPTALRRDRH